jgi:type VI secretion system secreted protein VgrG
MAQNTSQTISPPPIRATLPPKTTNGNNSGPASDRRTQTGRLISVEAPSLKDKDAILLTRFSGTEAISGLFQFKLDVLVDARSLRQDQIIQKDKEVQGLVGKDAGVTLQLRDGTRFFHGIVSRVMGLPSGGPNGTFLHYNLEIVPWTWLLTQRTNSRIFQNENVVNIIKEVFKALEEVNGLVSYDCDNSISQQHTALDYCVQYRESDFNFVSRLMEQEGLSYYFVHNAKDKKHKLVLVDDSKKGEALPWCVENDEQGSTISYAKGDKHEEGKVTDWKKQTALGPGKYTSRDYHMQLADQPIQVLETTEVAKDESFHNLEIYDYSAEYALRFVNPEERLDKVAQEGRKLALIRMEEQELSQKLMAGTSTWRSFACGHRFKLQEHPTDDGAYVLTSVKYNIPTDIDYISAKSVSSQATAQFMCVPHDISIRPLRSTPKPLISGPQTATVAVKAGEDSCTDMFGRVRVQFHWERAGKNNETSACWVRVAQSWAGNSWGMYFWPRVGDEVVVEFMEGDPDHPLITGSVFNKLNMPPYQMPIHYTRSGIKTRSSNGGGNQNFNELRFEDKQGQEQIFINAERDMDHRVENDHRIFVGAGQFLSVGGVQNISIGKDQSSEVAGNYMEKVGGKFSLQVGDQHQKVNQVYTLSAGSEIHLHSDAKIVIDGGSRVSIKVGGSFIDISDGGIAISGKVVNINSGGSADTGTDAKPDGPKGPEIADDGSKGTRLA